ncbi:hypothetical protein ACTFIY_003901 [Dictyostelium cf. discoideum]
MNNEYNERLFWKVFKNKYLLNYILKNKCCHKSKKFKTIISIYRMLKHKQYQLLICELKANENLYFRYGIDFDSQVPQVLEYIKEIKDFEVSKEIHSLLFLKGYEHHGNNYSWYMKLLIRSHLGPKFEIYLDLHLKNYPNELKHNKPFTLTSFERNRLLINFLQYGSNPEELMEKLEIISKISISPVSPLEGVDKQLGLGINLYLKYLKQLEQFGLQNIPTTLLDRKFDSEIITEHIRRDKVNLEFFPLSVDSALMYFKMYYYSHHYSSIPTSIQTQIDIIIENSKHGYCTSSQSIKQLFQLLVTETKSIVLYTLYLKEYDEPIETIEINENFINILKFLLKNHIEIVSEKNNLIDHFDLHIRSEVIFKNSKFGKRDIIKFFKVFSSQKSIIVKDFDQDK